jgi:hypothetical protein
MIESVFLLSLIATGSLLLFRRRAADRGDETATLFTAGLLEFTVPLAIASALFTALGVWLASASSVTATTTIADIEWAIRWVRMTYIDPLHLSGVTQFLLAVLLVFAGMLWPQIRQHELLDAFSSTTKWIGRAYILATLCVSFTFLGSVYDNRARTAEVRLTNDIDVIDRDYHDYWKALEDVVTADLAKRVAADPALVASMPDLQDAASSYTVVRTETRAARERIASYPKLEYRDFELPLEVHVEAPVPRGSERAPGTRALAETRSGWNRRDGEALRAEAEQLRASAAAESTASAQVLERGFEAAQEHVGREIVAAAFRDHPMAELLKVVLDPAVLYAFRDVAARETDAVFRQSLERRGPLRDLVTPRAAALRAKLHELATRAAPSLRASAASCSTIWRQAANQARQLRASVHSIITSRAEAQYAREKDAFARYWRNHYRFRSDALNNEAGRLLDRILRRPVRKPPLERIAELRDLSVKAFAGEGDAGADLARLDATERFVFPGNTPLHDRLEREVQEIRRQNARTPWGGIRNAATKDYFASNGVPSLAPAMEAWRIAERDQARELIARGERWDGQAWERFFADFCERNSSAVAGWSYVVMRAGGEGNMEAAYARYLRDVGLGGSHEAKAAFSRADAENVLEPLYERGHAVRPERSAVSDPVLAKVSGAGGGPASGSSRRVIPVVSRPPPIPKRPVK